MIPSYKHIAQIPRSRGQSKPITLDDFKFGLNTVLPPASILPNEASSLVNFKILPLGGLEIREGLTRYTTSALINPASYLKSFLFDIDLAEFHIFEDTDDREWENSAGREWMVEEPASSGMDELIVTQPGNVLYFLSATKAPSEIATLEGDATIIPFGDKAFICDGSFLKYWNRSTKTVLMAYDDGSGTNGYQRDNTTLTPDTQIKLYSGGNTKAGVKFDTQDWDSGYTITATKVEIYAKKVGSPTGNVGCEIYTNAGVLFATSTTVISAAAVDTASDKLSFVFSSGAMSPLTFYWPVLTYSGGDASNYIQLECDATTSDGDGKYYDGSWNDDATKIGVLGIKPGRPPRARFGLIQSSRLYLSGDPYNKGVVWYSNASLFFDWSTANGGGYIGVIDDNVTNFPVGALLSMYGNIYVFGQQSQPYLCKLLGSDPSDYSLPPVFQKIYSTYKTAINVTNDCWFGSESGINALSGVELYGDLRTFFESEAVDDRIQEYWTDDDAFAGYFGATGQYFLKMKDYPRCLVVHTKAPVRDQRGKVRYPWTEYIFVKENLSSVTYKWTASATANEYYVELTGGGDPSLSEPPYLLLNESLITNGTLGSLTDHQWDYGDNDTLGYSTVYIRDDSGDPDTTGIQIKTVLDPTAFANYDNKFFVACDDGYIYKMDSSVQEDNSIEIPYVLGTKLFESPYSHVCLEKYNVSCGTEATSATLDLEIYNKAVSIDTIHSVDADVSHTIDINENDFNRDLNANYKKFLAVLRNVNPDSENLRINNISLVTRALSR